MREMEEELERLLALQQFEENQRIQNEEEEEPHNPFNVHSPIIDLSQLRGISPFRFRWPETTFEDNPVGESYFPGFYSPSTFGKPSPSPSPSGSASLR